MCKYVRDGKLVTILSILIPGYDAIASAVVFSINKYSGPPFTEPAPVMQFQPPLTQIWIGIIFVLGSFRVIYL